jgi:polysaccharide pyruvyl transferase WcaK-like protein
MKNKKIYISGIWNYTQTSLGGQALSDGIVNIVEENFTSSNIHLGNMISFFRGADRILNILCKYEILFKYIFKFYSYIYKKRYIHQVDKIKESDLLIINGDGVVADIFPKDSLQFAIEIKIALDNGIEFVSMNQSINVKNGSFVDCLVKKYFLQGNISLREVESYLRIKRYSNNDSIVNLSIDSAFLTKNISKNESLHYKEFLLSNLFNKYDLKEDEFIIVGIRGNRPPGQTISIKHWAEFLQNVEKITSKKIVFVSTTMLLDYPIALKIKKIFNNLIVIDEILDYGKYNYRVIEYFISLSYLSISDRYHQNVFSLLMGTPLIAFEGNTSKTQGLIDTMGYEGEIYNLPDKNNIDRLLTSLSKDLENLNNINFNSVKKNIVEKNTYSEFFRYLKK